MTIDEATEYLIDISYKFGNISVEYLTEKDGEKMREAINVLTNEQQTCEDAVSRQAVKDKLLKLCNELEGIFADIRMKEVDDCVCGLCEYDCDHGIDGSAFECPGFETDECFKLADEIRYEWQNTKDLPSVNPQPTECEDAVSRQAVLDVIFSEPLYETGMKKRDAEDAVPAIFEKIKALPSVNPQPKTKWIPVSERLPEDSELVLFSTKTDRVFEGRFFADNTNRQWYAFCDETFAWNNVVTAWMPLPQPYEPQESEVEE